MFELFCEEFEDSIRSTEVPFPPIPQLYATENIPIEQKEIHLHFFIRNSHWYIAEYDPEERLFFGYTILNGDTWNAEWGYTSLDELLSIDLRGIRVERDLAWKRKPFCTIDQEWQ